MTAPVIAAFDLDGTLAERDTLIPFLRMTIGMPRLCGALGRNAVRMARAKLDRELRDAAKEHLLVATIGGMSETSLREIGARYAPTIALRDDVVARLRDHQLAGHETVVVTASPSIYVDAFASRLGMDHVVATELEVVDGCITGRFAGENCRAAEKLRRLEAFLGGRDVELHAYGNAPDDDAMLARADVATYV
jgi:phosphatidylglycerophosphatase C